MKSPLWWLSLIFGTLSIVMLIKNGFEVSFVSSLQIVLDFYERAMHALFGWAEPWIKLQLATLGAWLALELHLQPTWKHVFVLMWMYFGSDARVAKDHRGIGSALFRVVLGGMIAASAGVATASVVVREPLLTVLTVAFPVSGVLLYGLGVSVWNATFFRRRESWWSAFVGFALFSSPFAIAGLGAIGLAALAGNGVLRFPASNPGLILLGLLVCFLAIHYVTLGALTARRSAASSESWWQEFFSLSISQVGFGLISTISSVALFLLVNAGLQLVGL